MIAELTVNLKLELLLWIGLIGMPLSLLIWKISPIARWFKNTLGAADRQKGKLMTIWFIVIPVICGIRLLTDELFICCYAGGMALVTGIVFSTMIVSEEH